MESQPTRPQTDAGETLPLDEWERDVMAAYDRLDDWGRARLYAEADDATRDLIDRDIASLAVANRATLDSIVEQSAARRQSPVATAR
jgi:hypothetical protein